MFFPEQPVRSKDKSSSLIETQRSHIIYLIYHTCSLPEHHEWKLQFVESGANIEFPILAYYPKGSS